MLERLHSRHLVLLGIGHTNAHIVRMWGMHPIPDTDLTCLSDSTIATYSGWLPAALAGQIQREQMEIDLVRLCASVGARLITDTVVGLDHDNRQVVFEQRPSVPYDVLSIGIGSVPTTEGVSISGESLIKIKPMQTFLDRLRATVEQHRPVETRPLQVVIVGSGVAGIEITFCLPPMLSSLGVPHSELRIVTRSEKILPELSSRARNLAISELQRRGVTITVEKSVKRVVAREVELSDGTTIQSDIVIWATGASPPPLLKQLALPLDDRGFLATNSSLASLSGQPIFAVGDTGTIVRERLPKAGVFAVRQSPVLWENIQRSLRAEPLTEYKPQRSFMKLLNMGDGRAIGQWRGLAFSGRWVMHLKNYIDSKFMDKFSQRPMSNDAEQMQCRGCGSKLGAEVLQQALASTQAANSSASSKIEIEDAVEIGRDGNDLIVASTDFFSCPTDDANLNGRIAALHSASDIIVTGSSVTNALANVVLLEGDRKTQRRTLSDFLIGARYEFDAMGAAIVGGHTIVGPRMEVGFTVIGQSHSDRLLRKSKLKAGDQLFLTKPLGIGVLLAAQRKSRCAARDYERLIEVMLRRQHEFAQIAVDCGIEAGTDITGFGLCGHLLEMLSSSEVAAEIFLESIPLLEGAIQAVQDGIESSLIYDNLRADDDIDALAQVRATPAYRLLFDPQTCGGFLFGCSQEIGKQFQQLTLDSGLPQPQWIGRISPYTSNAKRLKVSFSSA